MLFRRIYDSKLAQASYLIGCQRTGEAVVIDPNRDIAEYLNTADCEDMRITHVTETHIHADFVSGARELAAAAGAQLLLSDEGGADWQYRFPHTPLREGSEFKVGNVRLQVMHTPGHTPEHISFIVTDTANADRPMGLCTGDFIFVGDVGRPDLLEKAAGIAGTMESSARQLYASLQRARTLPDYLQVWPGHGAGSACGKALGAVPQSTLGYEKLFNPAFQIQSEEEFVAWVLSGQPKVPGHFSEMKKINRDGPPIKPFEQLTLAEVAKRVKDGAYLLDVRNQNEWDAGHIAEAHLIPLGELGRRAGEIPRDANVVVHCQSGARSVIASSILQAHGFEHVANMTDGFRAWQQGGYSVAN